VQCGTTSERRSGSFPQTAHRTLATDVSGNFTRFSDPSLIAHSNKKLQVGEIPRPYISTKNGIAHADPSRLLSDRDRKLAGRVRRVEDPVQVKEKAIKVSSSALLRSNPDPVAYEENHPNSDLDAEIPVPSWVSALLS